MTVEGSCKDLPDVVPVQLLHQGVIQNIHLVVPVQEIKKNATEKTSETEQGDQW